MGLDALITAVIFGFCQGGILFLISIGISIGFGLMRVINMEQGVYYSFGAYMAYTTVTWTGNFWLGMFLAMVLTGAIGLLVERTLLRHLYGKELMFTMVLTFSVFLIGIGVIQWIWGLQPKPVASPLEGMVSILGVEVPAYRLLVIGIAFLVYALIWLFLNKTIAGKAMRAGIEDPLNVQGIGINIHRIFMITFVIASALAGLGGTLNAAIIMVHPYMGFEIILFAFATVVLGGLGSIKGTLVSALIMGQVMSLGAMFWTPLSYVAPFMLLFVVIIFRPTGLYGVKSKAFGFE